MPKLTDKDYKFMTRMVFTLLWNTYDDEEWKDMTTDEEYQKCKEVWDKIEQEFF